jgi:hypothetical protein
MVTVFVVLAVMSIALLLQWIRNRSLRAELATAHLAVQELESLREENEQLRGHHVDSNELARLHEGQTELLRLRGRMAQLTVSNRHALPRTETAAPGSMTEDDNSLLFNVASTNRVSDGATLIVGGWLREEGKRTFLLASPILHTDQGGMGPQVSVHSQVITAPESFWQELGWAEFKTSERRSTITHVLSSDEAEILRARLQNTPGAELSNSSRADRNDGEYVGIAFSTADDTGEGVLMCFDLYPRTTGDGQSVDIELRPSRTTGPIHPSLMQAR